MSASTSSLLRLTASQAMMQNLHTLQLTTRGERAGLLLSELTGEDVKQALHEQPAPMLILRTGKNDAEAQFPQLPDMAKCIITPGKPALHP